MENNTADLPPALFNCFLPQCWADETGCAVSRRGAGGGTGACAGRSGMRLRSAGGAGKGQAGGDLGALPAGYSGGAGGGGAGGGRGSHTGVLPGRVDFQR